MKELFERVLLLKKSPMFSQVSTDDLRVVADSLVEKIYFKGDRVFDIGEIGEHMYILVTGKVGISIAQDRSNREFVAQMGPGECFGEMGMLDDLPRSATAFVLEDSRMLSLEKTKLRRLIVAYPELALCLLRGLSLRLRDIHAWSKAKDR